MKDLNNIDEILEQYADKIKFNYKDPYQILNELKRDYIVKDDFSSNSLRRKKLYDEIERKKGCLNVNSKVFVVTTFHSSETHAYIYINFSNDYIQVDGNEMLAYKITLLRGIKMEEANNKYCLYNYLCALQYFNLLIHE